jgi:hypothetical protein
VGLDGLGVGVFVGVGVAVGGGLVAWLAVGCGVGVEVLVLVVVGLAVGLADWLVVGATLEGFEGVALGVTLVDEEDDRPVGDAVAEALPEVLGDPARRSAESTRIAAFGRLAQAPFTMGGGAPGRIEAPKTLELDARSMKPVSALSATGLTRCALTSTASSWTSPQVGNCPSWSSQYACPD